MPGRGGEGQQWAAAVMQWCPRGGAGGRGRETRAGLRIVRAVGGDSALRSARGREAGTTGGDIKDVASR